MDGRGQQMAFAAVRYETNTFAMDCDVKTRGLKFSVETHDDVLCKGCRVKGEFYEAMDRHAISTTVRELARIVRFLPITVTINGKVVTERVEDVEWDDEDEDAYYKFDSSTGVEVYNRGMFVNKLAEYQFGTGGVIVTKQTMQLDMSRTQLLETQCEVWRRIKKKVRGKHRKVAMNSNRLTAAQRTSLVQGLIDGEVAWGDVSSKPIFVDCKGRGKTPYGLGYGLCQFTLADRNEKLIAEKLHGRDFFVFGEQMIDQWNLDANGSHGQSSLGKLVEVVNRIIERDGGRHPFEKMQPCEFIDAKQRFEGDHRLLEDGELANDVIRSLECFRRASNERICTEVNPDTDWQARRRLKRNLFAGMSDVYNGWTDSERYIAIHHDLLAKATKSEGGVIKVLRVLVHEYCHAERTDKEHVHGVEFYEKYHDTSMSMSYAEIKLVRDWCASWARLCATKAHKGKVRAWMKAYLGKQSMKAIEEGRIPAEEAEEDLSALDVAASAVTEAVQAQPASNESEAEPTPVAACRGPSQGCLAL